MTHYRLTPAQTGNAVLHKFLVAITTMVLFMVVSFYCAPGFGLSAQEPQKKLQDELQKESSWQAPDNEQFVAWIKEWAQATDADDQFVHQVVTELDSRINQHPGKRSGLSLDLIASLFPGTTDTVALVNQLPSDSSDWKAIIDPAIFTQPGLPDSAANQLRLGVGCWFARHERYDEALELLSPLETDQVIEPAELLFNLGMAQHRLLQSEPSVRTLNRLLENEDAIPRRYVAIAQLMIADIKSLKQDSLDEVARLMQDIRRRQALHRSGIRVINQEKAVLEKLDQMIEELEQKQASASQAKSGSAQPMQDSQNAGGKGSGDVTQKPMEEGGDWGSMPPQKRAAALAEMAKDMPPHYREVIEEYFRQLAKESGKQPGNKKQAP